MGLVAWVGRAFGGVSHGAEAPQKTRKASISLVNRTVPPGFRYLRAKAILDLERFASAQEFLAMSGGVF
ncbi:MAG TPA: hypothetical protein VEW69_10000, partial [Alphaproteobacteria bacterium]|nr:hypothetical protein [Alphaproteobacteria bacterium]